MGYNADGKLENFGRPELLLEAQRRTVERVVEILHERTREHTPIAKPPPNVNLEEWMKSRHGRLPGTLKESWKVGELEVLENGSLMRMDVYTNDEIAPYVEYPTMPHIIMPRAGGMLRFWDQFGHTVYATIVHHTGTKGTFMLTTALGEIAALWQEIGAEELERWARGQEAQVHA
jgi:hypothetical protein